jgi:hypothetical protein
MGVGHTPNFIMAAFEGEHPPPAKVIVHQDRF